MRSDFVVAVDPGRVTGVAFWGGETEYLEAYQAPLQEVLQRIEGYLRDDNVAAVVCEAFLITARTAQLKAEHSALDGIGALRYVCAREGVPLVLQTPADAKRFATDEKLRRLGWFLATEGGHRNDACRHLLKYLVDRRDIDLGRLL